MWLGSAQGFAVTQWTWQGLSTTSFARASAPLGFASCAWHCGPPNSSGSLACTLWQEGSPRQHNVATRPAALALAVKTLGNSNIFAIELGRRAVFAFVVCAA